MSKKFCLQVLLTKIGASYNTFLIDVVFTLDYYVMMQLCYQQLIHCANTIMGCSITLATPITLFVFGSIGWFLTYGIAVSNPQHVVPLPDWPTISNTGSFAPESCVFSQVFNMCAFLGYYMIAVYYKYCLAKGAHGWLSSACLYIGIIIMFGICHFIGAFMAFLGGIAFEWCSATLSLLYLDTPKPLVIIRYAIASGTTLSFTMSVGPNNPENLDFWANMTDGWEWALGLLHLAYFSTFTYEFSNITGTEFKVSIRNKSVNSEVRESDILAERVKSGVSKTGSQRHSESSASEL